MQIGNKRSRRNAIEILLAGISVFLGASIMPTLAAEPDPKKLEDIKPTLCKADVKRDVAKRMRSILEAVQKETGKKFSPSEKTKIIDGFVRDHVKLVGQSYRYTD